MTEDGLEVEGPFSVETNWKIAKYMSSTYVFKHLKQSTYVYCMYLSFDHVATNGNCNLLTFVFIFIDIELGTSGHPYTVNSIYLIVWGMYIIEYGSTL